MGNVIVRIKDESVTCELGKPVFSSNTKTPNFKCQVQGVVINSTVDISALESLLLTLPNYIDEPTAFAAIGPNKLFWTSGPLNDVEFPYSLKKTRSA